MYSKTLVAGWGDMDFNGHMKNTAFLDKSADIRMMFFAEHGFSMQNFYAMKIGPVAWKDEIQYFREVGLLQEIVVSLSLDGMSRDGSRFRLKNTVSLKDGTVCAEVLSTGGWLDLSARKLSSPPKELFEAMESLEKSEDFEVMPSSIKTTSPSDA